MPVSLVPRLLGAAALAATLVAGTGDRADAAIVACSASVAGRVTSDGAALPCQVSTTNDQDFQNANPITVNQEGGFFGFTDWELIDKVGSGQSGSYDVTQLDDFDTFGNWMLIFKSGNGTFLTGYLLDATQLTGSWSSPFEQIKNGRLSYKDVSHISFYGRGEPLLIEPPPPPPPPGPEAITEVPAPASLGLLAAGLLGLGLVRRRKA